VSLDDWILALHLLTAVAFVGAIVGFWAMVVAGWRTDRPSDVVAIFRLNPYLTASVAIGSIGTLVFGIWLAISMDAYEVWDGWVIAAIVLWLIGGALGKRTGDGYRESAEMAARLTSSGSPRSPELAAAMGATPAFWFHVATCVVVLLLILDMIWKPGA
jgi:uncharacterized membrane protein